MELALRRFVCYFLVTENYCSLVDIFWKNGSSWQAVRSADENVSGSVIDIFWRTEVTGKLQYVRSADENVGGSVVDII